MLELDHGGGGRRYVHGPGVDEPAVWYELGAPWPQGVRWYGADHQGSVVTLTDGSGAAAINRYDPYGQPAGTNLGRFQYTGQLWLAELGLYHYKARAYSPVLGRFLQVDPIGYDDQQNLYAYVGNDPVNRSDPTGLKCVDDKVDSTGMCAEGWEVEASCDRECRRNLQFMSRMVLTSIVEQFDLPPQKMEQLKPCISPTDGPVDFTGGGLDLVPGAGGGFGFYKFSIPSTGAEGWVASGGFLGGVGGSIGGSKGRVDNFANFTGFGWRGNFSTPIPAVGGEVIFGDKGNVAGGAASVGVGGGYYGGRTKTRVRSSNIPVCP